MPALLSRVKLRDHRRARHWAGGEEVSRAARPSSKSRGCT